MKNLSKGIFLMLCLNLSICFSQVRMPVSPDVEAFNQYADYPVSTYTGITSIDIPIFSQNGININLRYHSSGIKVSQEASSVGLGWNLNAGGVITQEIKGFDDFDTRYPYPVVGNDVFWQMNSMNENQFYERVNMENEANRPYPNPAVPAVSSYMSWNYYKAVVAGLVQPDVFNYSLGGYDGKFVINPTTKEVLLFDRSHRIKFTFTYSNRRALSFTAVTPDGTKYYFDNIVQSFETGPYNELCQPYGSHTFYLDRIVFPDGRRTQYEYNHPTGGYGNVIQKKIEYQTIGPGIAISDDLKVAIPSGGLDGYDFAQAERMQGFTPFTAEESYYAYTKYNKVTLKKITGDKNIILFDSSQRQDCQDEDRIDRIRVQDKAGNAITQFDFAYSYFNGDMYATNPTQKQDNHRLKLLSLTQQGRPPYEFTYNDNISNGRLPSKKSNSYDFWGYFNGKPNANGLTDPTQMLYYDAGYFDRDDDFEEVPPVDLWFPNQAQFPNLLGVYYTTNFHLLGGDANKVASEQHCKIGMLTEIKYPEGGKTKFNYELNSFSNRIYPSPDDVTGKHIVDENFNKKVVFFEVRDTVGIKMNFEFSMGDNPQIFEQIIGPQSYVKVYSFGSSKTLENLSMSDSKILLFQKGFQWIENAPTYTLETLTNFISRESDFFKFYPGKYAIEVELSDACGLQGSPTNHSYVSAMLGYAKRKVRVRGENYTSLKGKGGGLRIAEIENYDQDILKSYQKFTYEQGEETFGKLILPILFKTKTNHKSFQSFTVNFGGGVSLEDDCTEQQSAKDANAKLAKAGFSDIVFHVPPCQTVIGSGSGYSASKCYLFDNLHVYSYHSNPIPDMSSFGYEYFVGYDKVKVESSQDMGGYTYNYYINNIAKSQGNNLKVPAIPHTLNGKTSKTEYYDSTNNLVKKAEFAYTSFDKKYLKGCTAIDRYSGPDNFTNIPNIQSFWTNSTASGPTMTDKVMTARYNMWFYPINSSLDVTSRIRETTYTDTGNFIKETRYFHNELGQITKEMMVDSKGQVSTVDYQYAHDTGNSYLNNTNFLDAPLTVTKKLGANIYDQKSYYYSAIGGLGPLLTGVATNTQFSGLQSNLIVDNYEYKMHNTTADVSGQYTSFGATQNGANNYNTIKGKKTKYLYGYNYKYIVAKIEGIDADSTSEYLPEAGFQSYTGVTLENYLNTHLRNSAQVVAQNLLVTTYTYDPVTGLLQSSTDPKGVTINYQYDSLNRLQYVLDKNGYILKSYEYNYKNN